MADDERKGRDGEKFGWKPGDVKVTPPPPKPIRPVEPRK